MPKIIGKVEGRGTYLKIKNLITNFFIVVYNVTGNGIKTVLVNVIDIGQALNREAPEITKFFGCELGSQTTFSAETERSVIYTFSSSSSSINYIKSCMYVLQGCCERGPP